MVEQLAKDYSDYLKVDINTELHNVQETIDDMLTRLDEFENLVNMVKTDGELCVNVSLPQILRCKERLECLCEKIDRLDQFVNHVKSDMETLEDQVNKAEVDFGHNVMTLKNIFKPLFFTTTETASKKSGQTPVYIPPVLFSTSDYFPQPGALGKSDS